MTLKIQKTSASNYGKYIGFLSIVIIAFGVLIYLPTTAQADLMYYRSITIDHTKVPNSTQTDFPVLISGTYSYLATVGNGGKVKNSNGYDVGFYTNADCSTGKLAWEIEKYTAATGEVAYWVKIASLSNSVDTVFYICYGNSSIVSDQSAATSVWNTDYKFVLHLNSSSFIDSTAGGTTLTNVGGSATTGPWGTGVAYNGSSQYSYVTSVPSTATNNYTMSAWIKSSLSNQNGNTANSGIYFVNGAEGGGYGLAAGANGNPGADWEGVMLGVSWLYQVNALALNTWTYQVMVRDGGTTKFYTNSTLKGTTFPQTPNTPASRLVIGAYMGSSPGFTPAFYFDGAVKETRISNVVRSADWISTEYNNQSSPSTFYALGSENTIDLGTIISTVPHVKVRGGAAGATPNVKVRGGTGGTVKFR